MREIALIVLHHSTTPDGETLSWPAIRRYHTIVRGWQDVGYHCCVELYQGHYEALLGRPFAVAGAHAPSRNHDSIGVCFVGDFTEHPPPDDQLDAGVRLLRDLLAVFGLEPDAVVGHRDVTPGRTCPGAAFPLEALRGWLG